MHYQRNKRLGDPGAAGRLTRQNANEECDYEGCENPSMRSGLCWGHDTQKKKGQELRPLRKAFGKGLSIEEKLEMYSSPPNAKGCRIWTGGMQENGYPTVAQNWTGSKLAHRVSYMVNAGEKIASDTMVHHMCSNSQCVEPSHLQAVRPHENVAEMLERRFYKSRIAALEKALAEVSPSHPLLED